MKNKIIYCLLLVALTFSTSLVYCETIFLKNGNIVHGSIQKDTDKFIIIKQKDNKLQKLKRQDILRILYIKFYDRKVFIYKTDSTMISAFQVSEDQESYTFRNKLFSAKEFQVLKKDIKYISKEQVKPRIITKKTSLTFREKEAIAFEYIKNSGEKARSDRLFSVGFFYTSAILIPLIENYYQAPEETINLTLAIFGLLGIYYTFAKSFEEKVFLSLDKGGIQPLPALKDWANSKHTERMIIGSVFTLIGLLNSTASFIMEDTENNRASKAVSLSIGLIFLTLGIWQFISPSTPERMHRSLSGKTAMNVSVIPSVAYNYTDKSYYSGIALIYIF